MTYYEWEDERIVTPYAMSWSLANHLGINDPKSVNDGNSISYENKSTRARNYKNKNKIIIAFLKITLFKGKEKKKSWSKHMALLPSP